MNNLIETLYLEISGMYIYQFAIAFFIFFLFFMLKNIFAKYLVNKIKKLVLKTNNKIDDKLYLKLEKPLNFIPLLLFFFIINIFLSENNKFFYLLNNINLTITSIILFWFFYHFVEPMSLFIYKLEKIISKELVIWLIKSIKIFILILGLVAILETWGIKLGPILAGLGLIGVAVALGAQDLFKNLISGILIIAERNFKIGDTIFVPGHTEGVVENIGFRSVKIRKFDSTPITIPNYIFAEAPILNYSNRKYRRINWIIGLQYSSTLEQIQNLTDSIFEYISNSKNFVINENYKCYVRLEKFNESSIDILVYCFTHTTDWEIYLQVKEELALHIKKTIENIGLDFAFPSRTLYIENSNIVD